MLNEYNSPLVRYAGKAHPRYDEQGKKLRELRESKGLTVAEVSTRIGYKTIIAVTNWENGTRKPGTLQMRFISEMYDVSFDELQKLYADDAVAQDREQARRAVVLQERTRNELHAMVDRIPQVVTLQFLYRLVGELVKEPDWSAESLRRCGAALHGRTA